MMYSPPWSVKVLLSICPRKQAVGFQTFFALNFFPKAVENKLSKSVDTKSCDTNLSHWQEKGLEVRRWVWSGRPSTSSFPHPPPHSSGILPALPQSHCLQPSWGLRCFSSMKYQGTHQTSWRPHPWADCEADPGTCYRRTRPRSTHP